MFLSPINCRFYVAQKVDCSVKLANFNFLLRQSLVWIFPGCFTHRSFLAFERNEGLKVHGKRVSRANFHTLHQEQFLIILILPLFSRLNALIFPFDWSNRINCFFTKFGSLLCIHCVVGYLQIPLLWPISVSTFSNCFFTS